MELLLNLAWVLLALPTLLVSRRAHRLAKQSGQACRTNSLVLVSCVLVLLFPIVSATDDLLAMRLEIDESSPTKRLVKQSASPKVPVLGRDAGPLAALHAVSIGAPDKQLRGRVPTYEAALPQRDPARNSGCRAPPCPSPKSSVVNVPSTPAQFSTWTISCNSRRY
jgi:hypothetical protein